MGKFGEGLAPKEVISRIRRERFGLDIPLEGDAVLAVENLRADYSSALRMLSEDLYSKESHFVLELVQNADDNSYASNVTPKLVFEVLPDRLTVTNNEIGFSAANVLALCRVNKSTKTKSDGYIGEKGIGFKSVFLVSNEPEIHSNGFHFQFRKNPGDDLLGYVVPHWREPSAPVREGWTSIVLPSNARERYSKEATLRGLNAQLLLFLSKLREIELKADGVSTRYARKDEGLFTTLVERPGDGSKAIVKLYLRVSHPVDVSGTNEEKRRSIDHSSVLIAFPLDADGRAAPDPTSQAFAFLPIRPVGFKFCIHADFLLTSNREDIHQDKRWNCALRDGVSAAFLSALENSKQSPPLAATYLKFLPVEKDLHDFFKPVARQVEAGLKREDCILGASGAWLRPDQIALASPTFKKLFSAKDVRELFELDYPNSDFEASEEVLARLGAVRLQAASVLDLFKKRQQWLLKRSTKWLAKFYAYLSTSNVARQLLQFPCLLISGGSFVKPGDRTVFFPIARGHNYGFEEVFAFFDATVAALAVEETARDQSFLELLRELGVKAPSPYEIIRSEIIPTHSGTRWQELQTEALLGHVQYAKDHLAQYLVEAERRRESREAALKVLSENLRLALQEENFYGRAEKIYFSKPYKPSFRIHEFLGHAMDAKNVLSDAYLHLPDAPQDGAEERRSVRERTGAWRDFFLTIGVQDAPYLVPLANGNPEWDDNAKKLLSLPDPEARRHFLENVDGHWSAYAWRKSFATRAGGRSVSIAASFVTTLRAMSAPLTRKKGEARLHETFLDNENLREIFGATVPFVAASLSNPDFISTCGITAEVDAKACIKRLAQLREERSNSKRMIERLYRQLEGLFHKDSNLIKQSFWTERLIRVGGEAPSWHTAAEVAWRGSGEFLNRRFPPLDTQYADFSAFFLNKLGVNREVPIHEAVAALLDLKEARSRDEMEDAALRVYRRASADLSETEEPSWLTYFTFNSLLTSDAQLLTRSDEIYVNDAPDLARVFQDAIPLLAVPFEQRAKIEALRRELELPLLSEAVDVVALASGREELDVQLTEKLRAIVPAIARVIYYQHYPYWEQCKGGPLASLRDINVYRVQGLNLEYTIGQVTRTIEGEVAFDGDARILIRSDATSQLTRLSQEVRRVLEIPDTAADVIELLLVTSDVEGCLELRRIGSLPADEEEFFRPSDDAKTGGTELSEPASEDEESSNEESERTGPDAGERTRHDAHSPGKVRGRSSAEGATSVDAGHGKSEQQERVSLQPGGGGKTEGIERPTDRKPTVPAGERSKRGRLLSYAEYETTSDVDGDQDQSARDAVGNAAVQFLVDSLPHPWTQLLPERDRNNPGFDVIGVNKDGERDFIEVKGQTGPWTEEGVALTPNELLTAKEKRARYWLCVVEYATDASRRKLFLINDPFGNVQRFRFDSGWKGLAEADASASSAPKAGMRLEWSGRGIAEILTVESSGGRFSRVTLRFSNGATEEALFNPAVMKVRQTGSDGASPT